MGQVYGMGLNRDESLFVVVLGQGCGSGICLCGLVEEKLTTTTITNNN